MTPPARRQPGRAVGVPDYLWDARLGNYVNRATGRMVKRTAIQEALGAVCDRGAATLAGIAQAGQAGTLTPRQFYEAMQREVRQLYNASAALGRGGWAQMTPADWGRVGRALRDEYSRLRDFAQGLADGTISEKQAIARARLYADSAFRQYWRAWSGLQAGLGNDEEIWETSQDELVCKICRGLEALGWQPIGTLPEPGDPHPGDRCSKSYRRAADARRQPARPTAPDRAAILPPQLAALARARLTQTALTSLALTVELQRPGLHYGPGPHPDGSPQQVHGGGQLGFDLERTPDPPAVRSQSAADVAAVRYRWQQVLNVAFYDKTAHIEHGRELRDLIENAPYLTAADFAGRFVDAPDTPRLPAPKAAANASEVGRATPAAALHAIVQQIAGQQQPTGVELPPLLRAMRVSETAFDYGVYNGGLRQMVNWEHRFDLNQLRIRNGWHFDSQAGIISQAQALRKALRGTGYKTPAALWADIQAQRPEAPHA